MSETLHSVVQSGTDPDGHDSGCSVVAALKWLHLAIEDKYQMINNQPYHHAAWEQYQLIKWVRNRVNEALEKAGIAASHDASDDRHD